jgi:hypothetical protein
VAVDRKTAIERAFELADQGFALKEIRSAIIREGYDRNQLFGSSIITQLGKRISAAKEKSLPKSHKSGSKKSRP